MENARLVAEVWGEEALDELHRLARELHDSACQRLFSTTLHIRAAELTVGGYRLVQEALHNCVKQHAAATHVHVRLGPVEDNLQTLVLEIRT